ncbi:uncharacterized protein [Primulina huaijiensis]|uniref:uncharacterized protein isoform X2 n=1 Tax=Primulina huaijiensis TaxID=1492673 RepID=UPI003CC71771
MLLNLPTEGASNSGSSDIDGQLVLALRMMMEKEMEVVAINTFRGVILPVVEDLIRKVVKEEIQSELMTHGFGNRTHEATMPTESRTSQLKFLDGVSGPVLTGKEIEGKGGTAMRLAVVDSTTGKIINSGPEASRKVEILLLQADDDDNEHNWNTEDFNSKIIRKSDKEKPHVAKGMYVRLKEGVGILSGIKLGHGSSWKKRCLCRLGARFVDNSNGSKVKEAWTESFMVEDRRGKLYGKHYPPSLLDDVWRLENIGRDGGPCKDLYKENIITVQDFRFLLSIDPQRLRRASARELLFLAFENRKDITFVDDETSLVHQFPYESHDICIATDSVRNDAYATIEPDTSSPTIGPFMCPSSNFSLIRSERIQQIRDPSLPVPDQGPSSSPIALGSNQPFCGVTYQGPIRSPNDLGFYPSCYPSLTVADQGPVYSPTHQALSDLLTNPNYLFEHLVDRESVVSLLFHHNNNHSETCVESCSVQQSNAGSIRFFAAVGLTMWVSRVRKRVMDFCDFNVQKRQRIG